MNKRNKGILFGSAINDLDYVTIRWEDVSEVKGQRKLKCVWRCPFKAKWKHVMERCYSEPFKKVNPSYEFSSCVDEWNYASIFKSWMEKQDWQGKQLDKDLLFPGNQVYGPDTCVFLEGKVNKFLTERNSDRGLYPIGVSATKSGNRFVSQCNNGTGRVQYLGTFDTPEEAHEVWLNEKLRLAKILASEQTDQRIAKALVERYENYRK